MTVGVDRAAVGQGRVVVTVVASGVVEGVLLERDGSRAVARVVPTPDAIVGYGFSESEDVACAPCAGRRLAEGYHPELAGLGFAVPLLRSNEARGCRWCGVEVRGSSGYLAWHRGLRS